jgi:hypothetical protein
LTLPLLYPNAVQDDYIPNATFNGSHLANSPTFVTNGAPFVNYNTSIDISDNLTKIWHAHTIKTGLFMQRTRKDQTSFTDNNGSYNFGDSPSNPLDTGMATPMHYLVFSRPWISPAPTLTAGIDTGTSRDSCRTPGR